MRLVWEFEEGGEVGREREREVVRGKSKESSGINIKFSTRVQVLRAKDKD